MSFRYRLITKLLKVDTTFFKDSIVVAHLFMAGGVIRMETFFLIETGCKTYQTDKYFDEHD